MPRDFENYSISNALWNIGNYFWRHFAKFNAIGFDRARSEKVSNHIMLEVP